jgi:hypothetical protein
MQYSVGQVIYLLDPARNAVLPARVVEQVTKKTINGEEESFYVEVPGAEQLLNLSDFDGAIFADPNTVKNHLFETLKSNISGLVDKAVTEAMEKWGETGAPALELPKKRKRGRPKKVETPGEVATLIDLGDGRVGRLKE